MRFMSLASSSHGNAYIISDKETRILLECGLSRKKLQTLAGFTLSAFSACLVSHEHKDHSGCVADLIAAGIPVYMSHGTADALELETVEAIRHSVPEKIIRLGEMVSGNCIEVCSPKFTPTNALQFTTENVEFVVLPKG